MPGYHCHADPPTTLADRLRQLNDNLLLLGSGSRTPSPAPWPEPSPERSAT
jgi:hypothetical protein